MPAAAAMAGLTRWVRPPVPWRPSKLRFDVDAFRKHCLLNGLDDIALTLTHADEIRAFEAKRKAEQPWLF